MAVQRRSRRTRPTDPEGEENGGAKTGELTGSLPVVAPTGRRNGRVQAEVSPAPAEPAVQTSGLRRSRVIVRRLGPLSVFRFTLLYSFSVMLVIYLALAILYTVLGALGVRWAIRNGQRKWFAWTAFGVNFALTLVGFIVLLVYLVDLIPGVPY